MIDLDAYIERIREASFEAPKAHSYAEWRDSINRILNDLQNQIDAEWQESIDDE